MRTCLYFAILGCLLAACTHKPAIIAQPVQTASNTCDTLNITYKKDIQPIFRNNCYSCHGTIVVSGDGLDLEDSTSLKQYLENDFLGDGIYGSRLYHCILHSTYAQRMPPDYILDSCSLGKIKHWLNIDAPM